MGTGPYYMFPGRRSAALSNEPGAGAKGTVLWAVAVDALRVAGVAGAVRPVRRGALESSQVRAVAHFHVASPPTARSQASVGEPSLAPGFYARFVHARDGRGGTAEAKRLRRERPAQTGPRRALPAAEAAVGSPVVWPTGPRAKVEERGRAYGWEMRTRTGTGAGRPSPPASARIVSGSTTPGRLKPARWATGPGRRKRDGAHLQTALPRLWGGTLRLHRGAQVLGYDPVRATGPGSPARTPGRLRPGGGGARGRGRVGGRGQRRSLHRLGGRRWGVPASDGRRGRRRKARPPPPRNFRSRGGKIPEALGSGGGRASAGGTEGGGKRK